MLNNGQILLTITIDNDHFKITRYQIPHLATCMYFLFYQPLHAICLLADVFLFSFNDNFGLCLHFAHAQFVFNKDI
jgi:hypothetical protein